MQLEYFFPYQIAVAAEGFSRQLFAVYSRAFGLSREEWRVLFLVDRSERITSLDLARRSTLDKVQISRASQRLEEKGLISRTINSDDRRLRMFEITPAGHETFSRVLMQVQEKSDQILGQMTEEDRAALDHGLKALSTACAKVAASPEE